MSVRLLNTFAAAALALSALLGCGEQSGMSAPVPPGVWPTLGWEVSTPEAQGMSSGKLAELVEHLRVQESGVHSLLVVRHGRLVLDASFYPADAETPHDVASVTKSVTTTLLGIAIGEGAIKSLDQPVREVLGAREASTAVNDTLSISLRHLAAMRTGWDCGVQPGERELFQMIRSADWVSFALDLPRLHEPGTEFAYCSPAMHLLSEAIAAATGQSTLAYAQARLFGPLGIDAGLWPAAASGANHGWGDLRLRPHDLAKLGLLYLQRGQWGGFQVVPASWIDEATRALSHVGPPGEGYGLGWWTHGGPLEGAFEANGRGGQIVLVVPSLDVVVVTTGASFDPADLQPWLGDAVVAGQPLPPDERGFGRLTLAIVAASRGPAPSSAPLSSPLSAAISGAKYDLEDNPLGFRSVSLDFSDPDQAVLSLVLSDRMGPEFAGEVVIPFGLRGRYLLSRNGIGADRPDFAAMGAWRAPGRFWGKYLDPAAPTVFEMLFEFEDDQMKLEFIDGSELVGHQSLVGRKAPSNQLPGRS